MEREHSTFIGQVELQIEAFKKLKQQVGAVSLKLRNPINAKKDLALIRRDSQINFRLEDVEQTNRVIQLQFMLKGVEARRVQYRLCRARSMGEFCPIYASEVLANDKNGGSKWEVTDFLYKDICRNDFQRTLKIEFFEIKNVKEVDVAIFISEFDFSLKYLQKHIGKYMNCVSGKLNLGKVKLCYLNTFEKTQFIDYIYGGCDMMTMVAVDCTIANGNPALKSSMHYLQGYGKENISIKEKSLSQSRKDKILQKYALNNNKMQRLVDEAQGIRLKQIDETKLPNFNEYQEALYLCMSVLAAFDNDQNIPFLGFGAKLPPFFSNSSACFAMNGNIFLPECKGIKSLMEVYDSGIRKIQPHGPSAHAEVIRYAAEFTAADEVTQENQFYTILLIISRGEIIDMKSTVDAIVEAAKLPLSIVLVAVGDADRKKFKILDGDEKHKLIHSVTGEAVSRDIVQYVPFRRYKHDYRGLTKEILYEMAAQIKVFFEAKKIVPNPMTMKIRALKKAPAESKR